jgi:hypothetical protein
MEQIELLIEDYQRRVKTGENMIKNWNFPEQKERLKIKVNCFKTFITELERAKIALSV